MEYVNPKMSFHLLTRIHAFRGQLPLSQVVTRMTHCKHGAQNGVPVLEIYAYFYRSSCIRWQSLPPKRGLGQQAGGYRKRGGGDRNGNSGRY